MFQVIKVYMLNATFDYSVMTGNQGTKFKGKMAQVAHILYAIFPWEDDIVQTV